MVHRKRCAKCKRLQSLDKFKVRPDGYTGYCYKCEIAYYREYNKKRYASPEARAIELKRGREKYQSVLKPARMKRKARLIVLMGGECVRCGYNKSAAALDFHHRNHKKKTRTVSHFLANSDPAAWRLAREEAAKCELLCSNCHREETYPGHELDVTLPETEFDQPPDQAAPARRRTKKPGSSR